jgi:hypothetical protein
MARKTAPALPARGFASAKIRKRFDNFRLARSRIRFDTGMGDWQRLGSFLE